MRNSRKQLVVEVTDDGVLRIDIGVDTLVALFEASEENNPFVDKLSSPKKLYTVADNRRFANGVSCAMCDEDDIGCSLLVGFMKRACWNAVYNGYVRLGKVSKKDR